MKYEVISDSISQIYLCGEYCKDIELTKKEEASKYAKDMILLLRKKYHLLLSGYYQMIFYVDRKVGVFILLIKLGNDLYDDKTLDLKVVILDNQEFYLKTSSYDVAVIKKQFYFDGEYFYISLDKRDSILSIIEFGDIIYGDMVKEMLSRALYFQLR